MDLARRARRVRAPRDLPGRAVALRTLSLRPLVLRARVRIWWNLKRSQIRIAFLDGKNVHFKSFAEFGACCSKPTPDLHGNTCAPHARC